jgi:hypothetical protein
MTQTQTKVTKLNTARAAVAEMDEAENHLFISSKDNGETISYSYEFKEDLSWKELALFLGYMELVRDRIMCQGDCDD